MQRLALIPARGGSKRLPRKNILPFGGRPMIEWTIDAARAAELFSHIVVSTDDAEIAAIAAGAGAEILMRDAALASDAATLIEVLHHFVRAYAAPEAEIAVLLANCPLRVAADIQAGYTQFTNAGATAVLSVCSYLWTPPFRALEMRGREIHGFFGDWVEKKSQLYPSVVCPSGAVYWIRGATALAGTDLYVPAIEGFEMPWHRAIDIDTRQDFVLAECVRHALDHGFTFDTA